MKKDKFDIENIIVVLKYVLIFFGFQYAVFSSVSGITKLFYWIRVGFRVNFNQKFLKPGTLLWIYKY